MKASVWFISLIVLLVTQSCIHDYPFPVRGSHEKGENPTLLTAEIEVSYNLSWENIIHQVELSNYTNTKARREYPHRFVFEVIKDGEMVCHDEEFLTSEEFSLGELNHKLSAHLEPALYQVAVWYDFEDENGKFPYTAESLYEVSLSNFSTTDAEALQCAYATDFLDLSEVEFTDKEITVKKDMELLHPGARFEIIATDIQQFITDNKASLNQGDSFTVYLTFTSATPMGMNLYSQKLLYCENPLELSGRMRLPFAQYDELKIAEGFIFCNDEEEVSLKLCVKSSSLITVSQTDYFCFPIKRGHITTIYGDLLTNPIDGVFSIDNIWEGEIVIEI